jgi:glycosyltransferase involved in cell wall biosynthesis
LTAPSPPRVSVLMTVLNGERYLDEAITSVIGQDFADFELVVVDDGSTDATPSILERWAARDPRVRVLRNETNLGISQSANLGLAAARGAYVARLDADDLCMPGRLRAQVEVLDRERDVVLVSTCYEVIDAGGRPLSREWRAAPPEVIAHLMHFSNALGGHSQVMFRRDVVRELGGYREDFDVCVDYELWSRLVRRGRIVVLPLLGMKYRLHEARVSVVKRERQRQNSHLVTKNMLTALFGEEPSADDLAALASVWRDEARPGSARRAHRILSRAYELFRAGNGNRSHRARVRIETARRWTFAAIAFARRGELREAAIHIAYALRWHPRGVLKGVMMWTTRMLTARRLRGARSYDVADDVADESKSLIPIA